MQTDTSVSRRGLFAAASATAIPVALAASTAHAKEAEPAGDYVTLNANGEGSTQVMPDMAYVTLSVQATASNSSQASSQASDMAEAVRSALIAAGVEETSIETSGVSVSPVQDQGYPYGAYGGSMSAEPVSAEASDPEDSGIVARIGFSLSDVAVSGIASVLEAAIDAGATTVNEVSYYASDEADAYRSALVLAIADAQASGAAMAQTLSLGTPQIVRVQEISSHSAGRSRAGVMYDYAEASGSAGAGLSDFIAIPTPIDVYASVSLELRVEV